MKPIKISIKGFNSFIEEQNIDFEKLMSKGMFGIFGPTGSGKSTVLDAITFALYGKIARESSSHSQYININTDSAIVVFEFEVETNKRERYKIIREIKRNKKGTTNTSQCKIIKMGEEEQVLGEKERETTEAIKKIIGLEYNDFIKTVVLPQGSFNEFIKLEGRDRREILERLFGLQKYGKLLEDKIGNRARQIDNELRVLEGETKAYEDIDPDIIKKQEQEIEQNETNYNNLKEKEIKNDKDFALIKKIYDTQSELLALREEFQKQLSKKIEFEALEQEIKNSQKASLLAPLILDYNNLVNRGKEKRDIFDKKEAEHKEKVTEYETISKAFELVEKRKKYDYVNLLQKQTKLNALIGVFQSYENNDKELKKLSENIAKYKKEKEEFEQKAEGYNDLIKKLDESTSTINIYLQANKIDVDYKKKLTNAKYLSEQIADKSKGYSDLENEQKIYAKDLKMQEAELLQVKKKIEMLDIKIKSTEKKLDNLSQDERAKAEYIINLKTKYNQDLSYIENYVQMNKQIQDLKSEGEKLKIQKQEKVDRYAAMAKKLEILELEYNEKLVENTINDIKHSLCDGDECPICSNKINKRSLIISENTEIESIKKEIELLKGEERELSNAILLLTEREKNIVNEIVSFEKSEAFSEKKDLEQIKADFFTKEEESKALITKFEELQKKNQTDEKEKNNLENKLAILETKIQSIQENISKNAGDLQNQLLVKDKLQKELENLGFLGTDNLDDLLKELNNLELEIEEKTSLRDDNIRKKEQIDKELKVMQSDAKIIEINLAKGEENYRNAESIKEQTKNELMENLGEIKDPKPEIEKISNEIEDIEKQYAELEVKNKNLYEAKNRIHMEMENEKRSLTELREQAKEKQNKLYLEIANHKIHNINDYEEKEKLKKLNELKSIILSWERPKNLIEEKERLIAEYSKGLDIKKGEILSLEKIIGDNHYSEEEFRQAELENKEIKEHLESVSKELQKKKIELEQNIAKIKKQQELQKRLSDIKNKQSILKELKSVVGAKKFVEFIAMKQLKYITLQATQRLNQITNGAYGLEVDEEGIFKIRDNKNGGMLRTVRTLSGGETFVVSLSLALALSAQIQLKGVSPLELFFLDEGFGTLDDGLLEVVVDSLEKIQGDRLNVGVISHIEMLKQRMPVKLLVSPAKSGEGGSKVRIEYS